MRSIIIFLFVWFCIQKLNAEIEIDINNICRGDNFNSISTTKIMEVTLIKCSCNCSAEESVFFIKGNTKNNYIKIDSSRVIKTSELFENFYKLKENGFLCQNITLPKFDLVESENKITFMTKYPPEENFLKDCFKPEVTISIKNQTNSIEINRKKNIIINNKALINKKTFLYKDEDISDDFDSGLNGFLNHEYKNNFSLKKTKMYLIKGDEVNLLGRQVDSEEKLWYLINYVGKKDLILWVDSKDVTLQKLNFSYEL